MRKRLFGLLIILVASFTMLAANQPSGSRFNALGHKLMCVCGCNEILLECNHVGCPDSDRMIGELRVQLASGSGDTAVLNWFSGKYGPIVLAAPIRGGFDTVAWIVPFAALLLAIAAVFFLIRLWKRRQQAIPAAAGAPAADPGDDDLRARIRRETEWQ